MHFFFVQAAESLDFARLKISEIDDGNIEICRVALVVKSSIVIMIHIGSGGMIRIFGRLEHDSIDPFNACLRSWHVKTICLVLGVGQNSK
jgi:hypothetical protein